jgi:glutamate synthase (NADPH/NADH) large chain
MTGLYNAAEEHENCGLAFVASLTKSPSRQIVEQGLEALLNLDHRGAVGAEENSGDGAGILVSMPDQFLRDEFSKLNVDLPEQGQYAAGIAFINKTTPEVPYTILEELASLEGLKILGQREVPVDDTILGATSLASMPRFVQFVIQSQTGKSGVELNRQAYRFRKILQNKHDFFFASLNSGTITYKGMLTTRQLPNFFLDLQQHNFEAKISLVHSRFSTNTFPSWELAQPLRQIAHNGEINTIRGNRNWLNARQGQLNSPLLERINAQNGGDIEDLYPILTPGFSDSGSFDEVLELLHLSGRSLPHAVLMMIPEAFENWVDEDLTPEKKKLKAFYEYNSTLIEPWDGPASLSFTDGHLVGSVLDRNGLRPGRFWATDEIVIMASEVGVIRGIDKSKIVRKGRLEPGKMLLVNTDEGRIIENDEIKDQLAKMHPYDEWTSKNKIEIADLPDREHIAYSLASIHRRQRSFGYTEEEIKMILAPMAQTGGEPLGAMGSDTPIAVLSDKSRLLFDYFTQDFAQVTNPPLDSIREKIVTSIGSAIGPEPNLLEDSENHARKLMLPFPVIDNDTLSSIKSVETDPELGQYFKGVTIQGLFKVSSETSDIITDEKSQKEAEENNLRQRELAIEKRLDQIFDEVDEAIDGGCNFIILSDRGADASLAPIPSLFLTAAVQHHLLRKQTRTKISMLVEAGDVRETHHVALLIGYGAAAVNPYLAMETVEFLANSGQIDVNAKKASKNLINALGNGVLKIMSKMGISTIMSYRGSQIFGAVGLSKEIVDKYFTGTTTKIGGVGIRQITNEVLQRHAIAYPRIVTAQAHRKLRSGGEYKWRKTGEEHLFDPEAIFYLQQATDPNSELVGFDTFKKYTKRIDDNSQRLMTIRSLFNFEDPRSFGRQPIPVDEVEPISEIVKRFSTGAMSYGSISKEAHETLAIAMNRIGARSNSGEGGEDLDRIYDPNRRSKIKQVASGRFGVTSEYLVSADDIQIKLAQGAKPGEGGHLPGTKVYPWVATTRHSTPGIDLVSPPPHHDIYSIEDLAELIHDLKMANPLARIHVKLVSEYGVGTIAAGVSKAHADVILISGADGGTGAAPLSSIKHAGQPWEIGLAEAFQTLVANDLRDRVVLQCDGQLKTGRDVIIAALLGAEEFGFATAPLVVEGCVMMRVCNKNTCPVGVATQDPELRAKFKGSPEAVVNYFEFIAQEVREYLAQMGFKTFAEAVGQVEVLSQNKSAQIAEQHYKAAGLDLSSILAKPVNTLRQNAPLVQTEVQNHDLEASLDAKLMDQIDFDAIDRNPLQLESVIQNTDRTFGTLIGYEVTKRYNSNTGRVLSDDSLQFNLRGEAGQSIGAFLPQGITIHLTGEANDYCAKGLSGGKLVVRPDLGGSSDAHLNIIAGNVIGFGATSGTAYFAGVVGERFAVRNSGALLVAQGTGDHALEYMTGGTVVILGDTGKNLGAGFLGGQAYVLDLDFKKMNREALSSESLQFTDAVNLPESEQEYLKNIIVGFSKDTNSDFGEFLLTNWTETIDRITKIVPKKYQAVMQIEDIENNWDKVLEITK